MALRGMPARMAQAMQSLSATSREHSILFRPQAKAFSVQQVVKYAPKSSAALPKSVQIMNATMQPAPKANMQPAPKAKMMAKSSAGVATGDVDLQVAHDMANAMRAGMGLPQMPPHPPPANVVNQHGIPPKAAQKAAPNAKTKADAKAESFEHASGVLRMEFVFKRFI